jgi:glyoxylase-like metal-dependent hydrolase (beta-lactamase superfamily II)
MAFPTRRLRLTAPFFDRITCGDAVVTRVATVKRWWFRPPFTVSDDELRQAAQDADDQARLPLDFTSLHIALGNLSVIVDPGRLTAAQRIRYRDAELTPGLAVALAEIGIDRQDVTHVVVSHAHADHFFGITDDDEGTIVAHPNARHHVSRIDWERARNDDDLFRRLTETVDRRGLVDLADGDLDIAPGLSLLATPGETPGHLCVRLRSAGSTLFWIGDVVHHSMEFEHPTWAMVAGDADALHLSRLRIFREAVDSNAIVVWAHAPSPSWGRVEVQGGGYRWRPIAQDGQLTEA